MTNFKKYILTTFLVLLFSSFCFAQEEAAQQADQVQQAQPSLEDLVTITRKAKDRGEFDKVYAYVEDGLKRFGSEAKREESSLKEVPPTDQIDSYKTLNNVALLFFIKGEALKKQGKIDDSIKAFQTVIDDYSYSQAFDPRGRYFKLADTAKEAIDRMKGIDLKAENCGKKMRTKVDLYDPGKEDIVDYETYGEFQGVGTKDYKYVIKDQEGLADAVGEGIYPNTIGVRWDPAFATLKKEGRLKGSHWDFVQSPDLEAAFIKWALAPEPPGVKLFYTGLILEKSGLIKQAIKAYYAIVVHFPYSVGWTYWHTPWYAGQAAIAKIKYLTKKYPQTNMKLVGAKIVIENGFDNNVANDIVITDPGKIEQNNTSEAISDKVKSYLDRLTMGSKIKRQLGSGKVHFVQYKNGDWQLIVDGKPYVIKGITYSVAKVGQSPDEGTLVSWMDYDYNHNGKCDGPYDSFIDTNGNNKQDKNEPAIGDFELMRTMGVNTIRLYHQPNEVRKDILRDLYNKYGIRVIMGDFLGKYALGSGAEWNPGTDYENPEQQKKMLESVKKMVMDHKDEPYLLMWLLGNENVYGVACNADKNPDAFFKFVNKAAKLIKSLDKDHPVAIASGDTLYLDSFAKNCPDVDMYGANLYRGDYGFGSYWQNIKDLVGRPAFVTEYGCPAYVYCYSDQDTQEIQAQYLENCWLDIQDNEAFGTGSGNAIGGVLFEWLDEWWKAYEPSVHDTTGLWVGPFPDGYMHEEWLGVCSQGDGSMSPFLRTLRKSYYTYQKLWK